MFFLPDAYKDKVSQPFKNPDTGYRSGVHPGTDWAVPVGTPVYAPTNLTIYHRVLGHTTMGNAIYCKNDDYYFRFMHLSKAMQAGEYKQGEVIGYTGNTGWSTAPHIHVDVWTIPIDARKIYTRSGVDACLIDPVTVFT